MVDRIKFRIDWLGFDWRIVKKSSAGRNFDNVSFTKLIEVVKDEYERNFLLDIGHNVPKSKLDNCARAHSITKWSTKSHHALIMMLYNHLLTAEKDAVSKGTLVVDLSPDISLVNVPDDILSGISSHSWDKVSVKFVNDHPGYAIVKTSSDGNCMYNAISLFQTGSEGGAGSLRIKCAEHAISLKDVDSTWKSMVSSIYGSYSDWLEGVRGTEWGDELALYTLLKAASLNCVLFDEIPIGFQRLEYMYGPPGNPPVYILRCRQHYTLLSRDEESIEIAQSTIVCPFVGCGVMPKKKSQLLEHICMNHDSEKSPLSQECMDKYGLGRCKRCGVASTSTKLFNGTHRFCVEVPIPVSDTTELPKSLVEVMSFDQVIAFRAIPKEVSEQVALCASRLLRQVTIEPTERNFIIWHVFWRVIMFHDRGNSTKHGQRVAGRIRSRLTLWEDGKIDVLWNAFVAQNKHNSARTRRKGVPPDPIVVKRVTGMVRTGELAKAVTSIEPTAFEIDDDEIFTQLREMHPHSDWIPPKPVYLEHEPFEDKELDDAVFHAKQSSSPGPDWLSYRYIRDMWDHQFWRSVVRFHLNSLASGKITDCVEMVASARLVAIPKVDRKKVRPIAVGGSLRRLLAIMLWWRNRDEIITRIGNRQFGIGVRGGCDAMYHLFFVAVSKVLGRRVVFKADFSNAFNLVSRSVLAHVLATRYPGLLNYFNLCYTSKPFLFSRYGNLRSESGVQQGDPLGGVFFCMVLEEFLSDTDKVRNDAEFFDDLFTEGDPDETIDWISDVRHRGPKYGLYLNPAKSEWIGLNLPDDLREYGIKLVHATDCSILGGPVGLPRVIDERMMSLTVTWRKTVLRIVRIMDPQSALLLIRYCLAGSRFAYHCRVTPPLPELRWRDEVEQVLLEALSTITGFQIESWHMALASAAVRSDGLGLRNPKYYFSVAYLSSLRTAALAYSKFGQVVVSDPQPVDEDVEMIDSVKVSSDPPNLWVYPPVITVLAAEALRAYNDQAYTEYTLVSELWKEQTNLASAIDQALFNDVFVNTDDRGQRYLLARRKPFCNAWLMTLPYEFNPVTQFSPMRFQSLLSYYFGRQVEPRRCSKTNCHMTVEGYGDHRLICKCGSEITIDRHDGVANQLAKWLKKVGVIEMETRAPFNPEEPHPPHTRERPGDVAVTWSLGTTTEKVWIDVVVVHQHLYNSEENYEDNKLEVAAAKKRTKYQDLFVSNSRFVPFVLASSGELGVDAWTFVDNIVSRLTSVSGSSKGIKRRLMTDIQCALQQGNASMLTSH
jgi:hypothetical protein